MLKEPQTDTGNGEGGGKRPVQEKGTNICKGTLKANRAKHGAGAGGGGGV